MAAQGDTSPEGRPHLAQGASWARPPNETKFWRDDTKHRWVAKTRFESAISRMNHSQTQRSLKHIKVAITMQQLVSRLHTECRD